MSSPSNSPARSTPAGASVWSCSHCTFNNPIRNTSCEICEAARLVGVDAGSSVVAADAAATPPRRRGGKRERVEVDADSPAAAAAAETTPPRRSGRKRERVEVDPDSPAAAAAEAAATIPPHRCGSERERAELPDVVDLCDNAGREAPLAKKGSPALLCTGVDCDVLRRWIYKDLASPTRLYGDPYFRFSYFQRVISFSIFFAFL